MKKSNGICVLPEESKDAAQIAAAKKKELEKVLEEYLKEEWGTPFGNEAEIAGMKLDNLETAMTSLRDKLGKAEYTVEKNKIKRQIKSTKSKINNTNQVIKDAEQKRKLITKLIDRVGNRLNEAMRNANYDFDVRKSGDVLKWFLTKRLKTGFTTVNQLPYLDIREIYNTLDDWFKKQDSMIKKGITNKKKGMGGYNWYIKDPAYTVMMFDKYFRGAELEQNILQNTDNKSADKVKYNDRYQRNRDDLMQFIYEKNITYFPDPNNQPIDINNLTQDEKVDNIRNIQDLEADILRGRTKYMIPKPVNSLIIKSNENVAKFKKEKMTVLKKYNEIVSYANKSGFHISKDIHEITKGQESYYYVNLKNVDKNGVETYDSYLVPHFTDDNNRVRFMYPITKKGNLNGKWVQAINDSINSKNDLPDVMSEGFRQAQSEKVFNGYNKNNDEINTKGYANYTKLDLSLDHPMFSENLIYSGTTFVTGVNLWSQIKGVRKLLNDVFEDVQAANVKSYVRLQKSIQKLQGLKGKLSKQYNMTQEQVEEHIDKIIDMIKLDDVLFRDTTGDLKVASVRNINLSRGIKDNYYPMMFTPNDNIVDRIKYIKFAKQEIERIEDQISQQGTLYDIETDRKKKNKLYKKIVGLKRRLLKYIGDKENDVPGIYQLELERLEAMIGLREPDKVTQIPRQQIGDYIKHRKLYTNSLKDPNPEILFGGARTDANVIPDYINNMIENKYANQLNALGVDVIPTLHPALGNYMVEEMKTALGRFDVEAGFFFDYSNERILNAIRKLFPGYTSERIQQLTGNIQSMISGASLGFKASFKNNLQSIMGNMILHGSETEFQVMKIMENEALMNEIVSKTGVTDTVQAIADMYISGIGGALDLADGFHTKKDIALFALARNRFVKQNKRLRDFIMNRIKDRPEFTGQGNLTTIVESIMKGTWEFVNGLAKGETNDKWLTSIEKKMYGTMTSAQIRIYTNWGLNAFGIDKSIAEAKGIVPYVAMIPGEKRMRMLEALRGVVYYCDFLNPTLKGRYTHPDAIEYARKYVASTMFQFSMEHYPKFMRGVVGSMLWKFKPYFFSQVHQEVEYHMNFFRRIRKLPWYRQRAEFRKILTPSDETFFARLLGVHKDDVGQGLFFKNGFPWMGTRKETGPSTGSTEIYRRFIHSRVLASLWTVMLEKTTVGLILNKALRRMGVGRTNAFVPGAESITGTTLFRTMQIALISANFINRDEEDEWYEWSMLSRALMPVIVNVALEMIARREYLSPMRLFGSWTWFGLEELFKQTGWTKD